MFRIAASELKRIMGLLGKFTASRVGVQILSCVHVWWSGNAVEMTATDLDSWLTVASLLPPDNVEDGGGEVCLPHKALANLAAAMDGEVELRQEQAQVVLLSGGARFALACYPGEQYPERPEKGEKLAEVPAAALRDALRRVASCCAPDMSRPVLAAVCWDGDTLVATDGTRLATAQVPEAGRNLLLPGRAMHGLAAMLPESGGVCISSAAGASQNMVRFLWSAGECLYAVTVRQIASQYPDWRHIIPASEPVVTATVERERMLAALRRMAALSQDGHPWVKLAFGDGVTLSTSGSSGEGEEVVPAEVEGELELRADIGLLSDGLKLASGDVVELRGWGAEMIQEVREAGSEAWRYYWLPLRGN